MTYIKVFWHRSFPDEPIVLYSEIDKDRWERRKVYVFRDGQFGYASETEETNSVWLARYRASTTSFGDWFGCSIRSQRD